MEMQSQTLTIAKSACIAIVIITATNTAAGDSGIYRRSLSGTVLVLSGGSVGTGVLVDERNRLVVTCNHVVGPSEEVVTFFPLFANGKVVAEQSAYVAQKEKHALKAVVVMRDPQHDLALLRLERLPDSVRAVPLAVNDPDPGDEVHTIGNSGVDSAALWRYSMGTVRQSYFKRLYLGDAWVETTIIETQLPINPGDSGGPILNSNGELVALNMATSGTQTLVSLGIDVREIQTMLVRYYLQVPRTRQQVTELFLPPRASAESDAESEVSVNNQMTEAISLIWVDQHSELFNYGTVAPGQTFQIHSWVGHVWIIRLADGTDAGGFVAAPGGTSISVNNELINSVKQEGRPANSEDTDISQTQEPGAGVRSTLTGRIWNAPIQGPGQQAATGYWLTQFNADGTFVELTVNSENVVVNRTEGRYALNADQLTMTTGDVLHWMGRIIVHNSDAVSFVYPDGQTVPARVATPVFSSPALSSEHRAIPGTPTSRIPRMPGRSCKGF